MNERRATAPSVLEAAVTKVSERLAMDDHLARALIMAQAPIEVIDLAHWLSSQEKDALRAAPEEVWLPRRILLERDRRMSTPALEPGLAEAVAESPAVAMKSVSGPLRPYVYNEGRPLAEQLDAVNGDPLDEALTVSRVAPVNRRRPGWHLRSGVRELVHRARNDEAFVRSLRADPRGTIERMPSLASMERRALLSMPIDDPEPLVEYLRERIRHAERQRVAPRVTAAPVTAGPFPSDLWLSSTSRAKNGQLTGDVDVARRATTTRKGVTVPDPSGWNPDSKSLLGGYAYTEGWYTPVGATGAYTNLTASTTALLFAVDGADVHYPFICKSLAANNGKPGMAWLFADMGPPQPTYRDGIAWSDMSDAAGNLDLATAIGNVDAGTYRIAFANSRTLSRYAAAHTPQALTQPRRKGTFTSLITPKYDSSSTPASPGTIAVPGTSYTIPLGLSDQATGAQCSPQSGIELLDGTKCIVYRMAAVPPPPPPAHVQSDTSVILSLSDETTLESIFIRVLSSHRTGLGQFVQTCLCAGKGPGGTTDVVYVFGTPFGGGPVSIAYINDAEFALATAPIFYCTDTSVPTFVAQGDPTNEPICMNLLSEGAINLPITARSISVQYIDAPPFQLWLMLYEPADPVFGDGIYFAYSPTPWGPWRQGFRMPLCTIMFQGSDGFFTPGGQLGFVHDSNSSIADHLSGPRVPTPPPHVYTPRAYMPRIIPGFATTDGTNLTVRWTMSTLRPYYGHIMSSTFYWAP